MIKGIPGKIARVIRGLLHLVARPARSDRGRGGFIIQPYRGYGSPEEIFLMGRVFKQSSRPGSGKGGLGRDLIDFGRRLLRRGVSGAVIKARFGNTEQETVTDPDGYFWIHMRLAQSPPTDRLWHGMNLALKSSEENAVQAQGEVFIPPREARNVVISDIDDTVVFTGVANKAAMLWRLFLQGAESRIAFPGVASFYRALHRGRSGGELNPILYVSRGPWSLYEVLEEFFHIHRIPVGPILFLREWGMTLYRPLPRRAKGHKLTLVRNMLSLYPDRPFILIGDSGQHDPEIYAQVVREHPGRIESIYIRNVSRNARRNRAIEDLAREVTRTGSTLFLAADSFAMAEHAAEHGFISPKSLPEVLREKRAQGEPSLKPVRRVRGGRSGGVGGDAVREVLQEAGNDSPPNVAIDPEKINPGPESRSRVRDERSDQE